MVSHVCFLTSNDHSATGLVGFDRFDGELGGVFVFSHNKEGNVPRTHCGETNGGRVDFFFAQFFLALQRAQRNRSELRGPICLRDIKFFRF